MTSSPTARAAAAERILADFGITTAFVREAGHESEIAVISAPREAWRALLEPDAAETVRRVKDLGYRYVAVDLDLRPMAE